MSVRVWKCECTSGGSEGRRKEGKGEGDDKGKEVWSSPAGQVSSKRQPAEYL